MASKKNFFAIKGKRYVTMVLKPFKLFDIVLSWSLVSELGLLPKTSIVDLFISSVSDWSIWFVIDALIKAPFEPSFLVKSTVFLKLLALDLANELLV